jgi:1,4-alpha-glucan branching enzyme
MSLLTDQDLYLFNEGSHTRLYGKLGAHPHIENSVAGTHFAVWAPGAKQVFLMADFNGWNKQSHPLRTRGQSGIWESFVPGVGHGTHYKYHIASRYHGYRVRLASSMRFRRKPHRSFGIWITPGKTRNGWRVEKTGTFCPRPSPFMKFISVAGGEFRKKDIALSVTGRSPSRWPDMFRT